jgi:hypothetical protein
MDRMVPTSRAEFLQLQPVLLLLLVLRRRVIAVLAIAALQSNDFAHQPVLNSHFQYWCAPNWHIDSENAIPSDQ